MKDQKMTILNNFLLETLACAVGCRHKAMRHKVGTTFVTRFTFPKIAPLHVQKSIAGKV